MQAVVACQNRRRQAHCAQRSRKKRAKPSFHPIIPFCKYGTIVTFCCQSVNLFLYRRLRGVLYYRKQKSGRAGGQAARPVFVFFARDAVPITPNAAHRAVGAN